MKRSIWFWLYFVLAIVLSVYFATRVIMVFTGRSNLAYVRSLSISADLANKDLTPIANAVMISPGTRAYGKALEDINARIMATPGVKNAATRRLPSGNISIHVELYEAVAQWTDGTYYYPLSADGTIVNKPSENRTPNTVVFRGSVPNDISAIIDIAHNMVDKIDYMEFIEDRRWDMHTTGGITVMLPEKDPATAVTTLINIDKNHKILSKDISYIDMRDNARILVK